MNLEIINKELRLVIYDMKQLPLIMTIGFLLFSMDLFSQSTIQIGASGAFSRTTGLGAEIVGNAQIAKNLSIGIGTSPIKFEEHSKLYLPVFGRLKYYYPLQRWRLFASLDPGYGIYPSEHVSEGFGDLDRKGAFYLSGGIGIMGTSKLAPYAALHFTKFGFTEYYGGFSQYRPISTFALTAGIALNLHAPASVFGQTKSLPPYRSREYYFEKSKRQKTTAWILLGSGIALIGSGIIIAAHQREVEHSAVAVVLVSGPGLVTSFVSIPFFIAGGSSKRKAMNMN
jgi:hypothetical protein